MLGVTAGEFRRRFPFEVSLERYVDLLITPYRETLRAFCPLNAGLWDQGLNAPRVSRPGRSVRRGAGNGGLCRLRLALEHREARDAPAQSLGQLRELLGGGGEIAHRRDLRLSRGRR